MALASSQLCASSEDGIANSGATTTTTTTTTTAASAGVTLSPSPSLPTTMSLSGLEHGNNARNFRSSVVFRSGTSCVERGYTSRTHCISFSARPRNARELSVNRLIHSGVRSGSFDAVRASAVLGLRVIAVILPCALADWLSKWDAAHVERAIACILIDAAGVDAQLPIPLHMPDVNATVQGAMVQRNRTAASTAHGALEIPPTPPLAQLIRNGLSEDQRAHPCPALPYVTEASRELDELLQVLADDSLWSISLRVVALHKDEELSCGKDAGKEDVYARNVVKLYERWLPYRDAVAKAHIHGRDALRRFEMIVQNGDVDALWKRVDAVRCAAKATSASYSCCCCSCTVGDCEDCANEWHEENRNGHRDLHVEWHTDGARQRKRRRLLAVLPEDLVEDVLVPRIVAAHAK